jgi:PAS domain-containing protein
MLKINPNSPAILRSYANFLSTVLNETKLANETNLRADEIEKDKYRKNSMNTETADLNNIMFDETNAVLTISGEMDQEGIILSANNAVSKLFGFSRHELIGKNISIIVPPRKNNNLK